MSSLQLSYAVASESLRPRRRPASFQVTEHRLRQGLDGLYGSFVSRQTLPKLLSLLAGRPRPARFADLNQDDIALIAYPDHVGRKGSPPLEELGRWVSDWLDGTITNVHLLPFYPATSDGGFAVTDMNAVDPHLGRWSDIEELAETQGVMVDCILNHVSTSHPWFEKFLEGDKRYADYFITVDRQRSTAGSESTEFDAHDGMRRVLTTFGPDEADLNYRCPDVLLEVVRSILGYVEHGARIIRLDAINHLWKSATSGLVQPPEIDIIVQIFRDVLDAVDPSVIIATGTNDVVGAHGSYVSARRDEARLADRNALPALLLHTVHSGDASKLTNWSRDLAAQESSCSFNFTASHDGIALYPVVGVLDDPEIESLIELTHVAGGSVTDGVVKSKKRPYELNITYFDAVNPASAGSDFAIDRFMVTQSIMLTLSGVPAVYLPSLFGSATCRDHEHGTDRDSNRRRFDVDELDHELTTPMSRTAKVFARYRTLLQTRRAHRAFHPLAFETIEDFGSSVFAVRRTSLDGTETILALHNVSAQPLVIVDGIGRNSVDLLTERPYSGAIGLNPYQTLWLSGPDLAPVVLP